MIALTKLEHLIIRIGHFAQNTSGGSAITRTNKQLLKALWIEELSEVYGSLMMMESTFCR